MTGSDGKNRTNPALATVASCNPRVSDRPHRETGLRVPPAILILVPGASPYTRSPLKTEIGPRSTRFRSEEQVNPTVAWILFSCVAQAHVIINVAGCDAANLDYS